MQHNELVTDLAVMMQLKQAFMVTIVMVGGFAATLGVAVYLRWL